MGGGPLPFNVMVKALYSVTAVVLHSKCIVMENTKKYYIFHQNHVTNGVCCGVSLTQLLL